MIILPCTLLERPGLHRQQGVNVNVIDLPVVLQNIGPIGHMGFELDRRVCLRPKPQQDVRELGLAL